MDDTISICSLQGGSRTSCDYFLPLSSFCNEDPIGNTGSLVTRNSITPFVTVAVGWLSFSFRANGKSLDYQCIPQLRGVYEDLMLVEFEDVCFSARGYKQAIRCIDGTLICWTNGRDDYFISIPQSVLDPLTPLGQMELMRTLVLLGGTATRYDANADETAGAISVEHFQAALDVPPLEVGFDENGDVKTLPAYYCGKAREFEPRAKRYMGKSGDKGKAVTLGNRVSGTFVRVYDKAKESNLPDPCTRIELELKKSLAHECVLATLEAAGSISIHYDAGVRIIRHQDQFDETAWSLALFGLIIDRIDFKDRAADSNITRCPRLLWWDAFINSAEKLSVRVPIIKPILKQVEKWLYTAVASQLAVWFHAVAENEGFEDALHKLMQMIDMGCANWSTRHRELVTHAASLLPDEIDFNALSDAGFS